MLHLSHTFFLCTWLTGCWLIMEYLHEANGFNETILRRQYGYFKDKPGKTLIETRVKLMTLREGAFPPKLVHEQGNWDSLNAPDDISAEKYLDLYLGETLLSAPVDESLQICFLTLNFETIRHQLSFWHSAIETFRSCQQDLHLAPARVITQRIESAWDLQSVKEPMTPLLTSSRLPSKELPGSIGALSRDTEKTYTLHWQSQLLTYTNDFNVYVWQPHLERTPSTCYHSATVIIPPPDSDPQTGASSVHRLLVIAHPPYLMPRFLRTEDAFVKSSQTQHTWNADHEKLRVLAIFFKWMVEDSSKLVDDMISKAKEMTYKGRRMPTRSKVQYLVHLDDCRRFAISDLKHARVAVDRARSTVKMDGFCCKEKADKETALGVFEGFQDDFDFLANEFEALETTISTAREQIIEQMSLAQGQRAFILTIAAAFFIPLSFIASIFGMNVQEPLFPSRKATTTAISPSPCIASTAAANTEPSEPSQHYWTMSQYLEISLPLTIAIIVLPMIAAPLFRYASQQYEAHRRQWHLFLVVFGAFYFTYLIITTYVGSWASNFIHFMIGYPVSGGIGVKGALSAYKKKEGRLRWSMQLLTLIVCLLLDMMTLTFVPWSIGPFLYIFLTSKMGVEYLRRIWACLSCRTRKQSATQNSSGTTV